MMTDTPWVDIKEYQGVLSIPGIRGEPAVVKAVTQVLDLKLRMYRLMPLDLIMLLGGPPPVQSMAPPPGAPGAPMPGQASPGKNPMAKPSTGGAAGSDIAPPKLPQPPQNPLTHKQDQMTNIPQ